MATNEPVKEIPMLYTTDMVRAMLQNLKTETRRLPGLEMINKNPDDWQFEWYDYKVGWCFTKKSSITKKSLKNKTFHQEVIKKCPYGMRGDLIWVRESSSYFKQANGTIQREKTKYRADERWNGNSLIKWKPNIHMPKVVARIWLQVESIGIERLQSISEASAIAEGIERQEWTWGETAFPDGTIDKSLVGIKTKFFKDYVQVKHWTSNAIDSYKSLWIKINGRESWDKNPWVWVVKFKVLSTTGKACFTIIKSINQ